MMRDRLYKMTKVYPNEDELLSRYFSRLSKMGLYDSKFVGDVLKEIADTVEVLIKDLGKLKEIAERHEVEMSRMGVSIATFTISPNSPLPSSLGPVQKKNRNKKK